MIQAPMQVRLSRPILAFGALFFVVFASACAFLAALAFAARSEAEVLSFILAGVDGFFVVALLYFLRTLVARIRWGHQPVLSFGPEGLSFTSDYRNVSHVEYRSITTVEFDANYRGAPLTLRCADLRSIQLLLNTADISALEVFDELKRRLPHLVQPYSTVRRLVSRRPSGEASAVAA